MKTIITTVGTSIITNYLSPEGKRKVGYQFVPIENQWRSLQSQNGNEPGATAIYEPKFRNAIVYIGNVLKNRWFEIDGKPNTEASAEISSILKIADGHTCQVLLLATDTLYSVMAAELIRDWFEKFKSLYKIDVLFQRPPVEFSDQESSEYVVRNLQAVQGDRYRQGFQNLFSLLSKLLEKYKRQVIFNITGGYKANIPPVVLFAQLENVPLCYLYEGNSTQENELIKIDELPFGFDYSQWEVFVDYLSNRQLRLNYQDFELIQLLRSYKIIEENSLELTPIGRLLEVYLRTKTDVGRSMFGYIAELLLFVYFTKEGWSVIRGYNLGSNKKQLEIDLILTNHEGKECWLEVKPLNKAGLKRALEQLEERLEYNNQHHLRKVTEAGLVVYMPEFANVMDYANELRELAQKVRSKGITPRLFYFKMPFKLPPDRHTNTNIVQNGIEKVYELPISDLNV